MKSVPAGPAENVKFRMKLYEQLARSRQAQADFWTLLIQPPLGMLLAFKTIFWTFNPKEPKGRRNLPFVTWPIQDRILTELYEGITVGEDRLIDKSRDMGASWIILGIFFYFLLTQEDSHFLVASRKEEYVDRTGNPKTLFWKLDYLYSHLPACYQFERLRNHMHFSNLRNGSVINGEATNPDLGAGDRTLAILLDELARVDAGIAQAMLDAVTDTTDCIIVNSTHQSKGHPYAKLRYSGLIKVLTLPWWERPERALGLYTSPALGKVTLLDEKYYQDKYGGAFNDVKKGQTVEVKDLEIEALLSGAEQKHALFVADGASKYRSPWYDRECRRRSPRNIAQNLDMDPAGSGDSVFDLTDLNRMRTDYVCEPDYQGEIDFRIIPGCDLEHSDRVVDYRFLNNSGRRRLKWWGKLERDEFTGQLRPDQTHNYIVGCDISLGTGASNSVASVYDVNTNRKVGSIVDAFCSPTHFAELVVATCHWVGGQSKPFLIWEANGPGGIFDRRAFQLGYANVYYRKDEKKMFRPRSKNRGWHSSSNTKEDLIYGYRESISISFREDEEKLRFINPDEAAISEAEDYIFYSSGRIGPSSSEGDEGGAKATHGDRVIADALCCLARADQPKAARDNRTNPPGDSFAARRREFLQNNKLSLEDKRWLS